MNLPSGDLLAPVIANGTFNFHCRPQIDYSGCPSTDREIISWFYWSMFIMRAVVLFALVIYTLRQFPVELLRCCCQKRAIKLKQGGKALGYYCINALAGNLCGLVFCLIMAQPQRFNIHPMISILIYISTTNLAVTGGYMTMLTWAEVVWNDSLQVKSSVLGHYRRHWYAYLLYRFIVETPLCILSASNVNNSYLIVHRIWLLDWTLLLSFVGILSLVTSTKLLKMLNQKDVGKLAIVKVSRFRIVFLVAIVVAAAGTILHSIFLEKVDNTAWLAAFAIGSYHIPGIAGSIWFLVAQPVKVEVTINTKSAKAAK